MPIFGLMAAIAYRFEREELRRRCPRCGKVVKIYDALCMRCGMELELPEVAVMSEAMEQRQRSSVSPQPAAGKLADPPDD